MSLTYIILHVWHCDRTISMSFMYYITPFYFMMMGNTPIHCLAQLISHSILCTTYTYIQHVSIPSEHNMLSLWIADTCTHMYTQRYRNIYIYIYIIYIDLCLHKYIHVPVASCISCTRLLINTDVHTLQLRSPPFTISTLAVIIEIK